MKIYIRISENQNSISGDNRWNSFDKRMILKKCWISLQLNLTKSDSVIVYHNNVRDKTLKWVETTFQGGLINFKQIDTIDESFSVPLADIKEEITKSSNDNDIIGLLEDDYLWSPKAFKVINKAFEYWGGFISPSDSPKNYTNFTPSIVFVGTDRHWRTSYISWNFFSKASSLRKHINQISNSGILRDINLLNEITKETQCINPLPGVATHCKEKDMTPLVNWWDIWQGIKV